MGDEINLPAEVAALYNLKVEETLQLLDNIDKTSDPALLGELQVKTHDLIGVSAYFNEFDIERDSKVLNTYLQENTTVKDLIKKADFLTLLGTLKSTLLLRHNKR